MATYSLSKRTITFTSPVGEDILLPESFQGTEGLSQLFDFQLELLAESGAKIDPKSIVGQKVTVGLQVIGASGQRYVNGLVASLSRSDSDTQFDTYRARIVPALWLLTLNTNCRIFQSKSVIDILKAVFQPYGLSIRVDAQGTYPSLDYCTQYRETDFQFVSRLMEQNGIFYFFVHTADDHQLVLADGRNSYAACPLNSSLQYVPSMVAAQDLVDNVLHDLSEESTMVAGKHTRWDYNFRNFASIKTEPVTSTSDFGKATTNERYDYPGAGANINDAEASPLNNLDAAQIQVSAVAEDVTSDVFHGSSNSSSFTPGYTFDVTKHTNTAWNRKYLLTQVTHTAFQSPSYRSEKENSLGDYRNDFAAIKSDITYKSQQNTEKPNIPGPQTGIVVGTSGDEIYLDKFGRIKVQFFWDRIGKDDENSSAWLRVAQQWAGKGWGTHFWPRMSDEVIISFLDGDPDHPIVVGSVYNGVNMPPYALPDNGTRSGILTRSSKGGSASNANELRFEDKMGSEQIYLHAEKDMDQSIENNSNIYVGKNENIHVKADQLIAVDGNKNETIGGVHKEQIGAASNRSVGADFNEQITGNYSLQTGQNQYNTVGQVYVVDSGQEVHIKGGMKVVIESSMALCLTGAGGFISIDPSGVTIQGLLVKINSGGAQLQGTPASPTSPTAPDKPVDAEGA